MIQPDQQQQQQPPPPSRMAAGVNMGRYDQGPSSGGSRRGAGAGPPGMFSTGALSDPGAAAGGGGGGMLASNGTRGSSYGFEAPLSRQAAGGVGGGGFARGPAPPAGPGPRQQQQQQLEGCWPGTDIPLTAGPASALAAASGGAADWGPAAAGGHGRRSAGAGGAAAGGGAGRPQGPRPTKWVREGLQEPGTQVGEQEAVACMIKPVSAAASTVSTCCTFVLLRTHRPVW
jgi:hypothetical protein